MAGFEVDAESLRRVAGELRAVTDDLDRAVEGLTAALSESGDPWGMDMLGTLIGGGYVAIEQLALETLDSIIDGFDSYADGLDRMAENYSGAEEDTGAQFDDLHRRI